MVPERPGWQEERQGHLPVEGEEEEEEAGVGPEEEEEEGGAGPGVGTGPAVGGGRVDVFKYLSK